MSSLTLALTAPNTPLNVIPVSARLHQSEYKHDLAVINVMRPSLGPMSPYSSGMPLQLKWHGGPGRTGVFKGYVDKVDAPFTRRGPTITQNIVTVFCYGITYPMKHEDTTVWRNLSADSIAKAIAKLFRLSIVADPHPYVWPTYAQGGKSYWECLLDLAKRIGYTLYLQDATLYFVDRRTAGGRTRYPHVYYLNSSTQTMKDIVDFLPESSGGDGLDPAGIDAGLHSAYGISRYSNKVFQVEQEQTVKYGTTPIYSPFFDRVITTKSPTSLAEAQTYVDAHEAQSVFTSFATVTVRGNAGLQPGGLIEIVSTDVAQKRYSGTWYINDVKQEMSSMNYMTTLKVGTDSTGTMFSTPTYVASSKKRKTLPPIVYRAGTWQAQWDKADV